MNNGEKELTRQDSDEWLCSSTYQPSRSEIVGKNRTEKRKTTKKKLKVVIPMTPNQSIRFERVENGVKRIKASNTSYLKPIVDDIADVTVLKSTSSVSRKNEIRLETNDTMSAKLKFISPIFPKRISLRRSSSPPVAQIRQSPEQVFASLTPKRRPSFDVIRPIAKRRKEEEHDEKDPFESSGTSGRSETSDDDIRQSDSSEVSNLFDYLSPLKRKLANLQEDEDDPENSPPKTQFSLNFITGYEAQFTAFEESQMEFLNQNPKKLATRDRASPEVIDYDPISIFEESEPQEARDLDGSPLKIDASPEKLIKSVMENNRKNEEKKVKKKLRFADPEEFEPSAWRHENVIEESCGVHLQNNKDYVIDMETVGIHDASSAFPSDYDATAQKYLDAESCAFSRDSTDTFEDDRSDEFLDKEDLDGLSARFASLMTSKSSERRLLMSDVVFGVVPRDRLIKLNLFNQEKAFGMSILGTSPTSVVISRSSSIRRLATSCSPSPSPPTPFVCDPAPSPTAAAATPSSPSSPPISIIYSIGALSSVPSTTLQKVSNFRVLINPALVSEGVL